MRFRSHVLLAVSAGVLLSQFGSQCSAQIVGTTGASPQAKAEPVVLKVGEKARLPLPPGPSKSKEVSLILTSDITGPVTIDARSLDVDTRIEVLRANADGTWESIGAADDGWIATNSRFVLQAEAGQRYKIVAGPKEESWEVDEDWGGEIEIEAQPGEFPAMDLAAARAAGLAYWDDVRARGVATKNSLLEVRALQGRSWTLTSTSDWATTLEDGKAGALALAEAADRLEKLTTPPDPRVGEMLSRLSDAYAFGGGGTNAQALEATRRAVAVLEAAWGPDDPRLVHDLGLLAYFTDDPDEVQRIEERVERICEHGGGACDKRYWQRGEFALARKEMERKYQEALRTQGPDSSATALALNNLAITMSMMGERREALPLYERALEILSNPSFGVRNGQGVLRRNFSEALMNVGEYDRALDELNVAIVNARRNSERDPDVAAWLGNLRWLQAQILMEMGRLDEAQASAEESLRRLEQGTGSLPKEWKLGALTVLGKIAERKGQFEAARSYFERALAASEGTWGHNLRRRWLESGLAGVLVSLGRHEEALTYTLEIEEKRRGEARVNCRGLSEAQALRLPNVRESDGLDMALSVAAGGKLPAKCGAILDSLIRSRALVLDEMAARHRDLAKSGDPEIAPLAQQLRAATAREARFALRDPGPDGFVRYQVVLSQARQDREKAEQALAEKSRIYRQQLAREAIGIEDVRRALPDGAVLVSYAMYEDRLLPAPRAVRSGDSAHREARSGAELAATSASRSASGRPDKSAASPVIPTSGPMRAGALAPSSRPSKYIAFVLRAGDAGVPVSVPIGSSTDIDHLVARWREAIVQGAHGKGVEAPAADRAYRKEADALRRRIWDPVSRVAGRSQRVFIVPDGSLNLVSLATLPAADGRYLIEAGPTFHYLSAERDLVRDKEPPREGGMLALGDPDFDATDLFASLRHGGDGGPTQPKEVDSVQVAAGATRTDGKENADRTQDMEVPGEKQAILAHTDAGQAGATAGVDDATQQAGPAGPTHLKEGEPKQVALVVGPTGPPDSKAGELKPVALVASLSPFRGARSSCSSFGGIRFSRLPGSAQEAEDVASIWNESEEHARGGAGTMRAPETGSVPSPSQHPSVANRLTGAAATESAFKAEAPRQRVLHVATHGFFLGGSCESALESGRGLGGLAVLDEGPAPVRGDNPLKLSGLVFAGANHRDSAQPDEDDGILTAEEIAALDLSGVEWAVLSACDTGVGEIKAGEGVFGLRRAFQVAGVKTLIMSLWAVEDEPTRQWMEALYRNRLEQKFDTAESVRAAGQAIVRDRRSKGESTHPFFWGAFVAAGDWR